MPPSLHRPTAKMLPPPPPSIHFKKVDYRLNRTYTNGLSPVGHYVPPVEDASNHIAVKYFNHRASPTLPGMAENAFKIWKNVRSQLLAVGFPDYHAWNPRYQITEHVSGEDLEDVCGQKCDLLITEIRHLLLSIIPHVGAMIDAGVVHGDIKAGNIIVNEGHLPAPNWSVRIIDLDSMRHAGHDSDDVFGTPYFMAPEVARGTYAATSDVFSLSMLALDLLCSERYPETLGEPILYGASQKNQKALFVARSFGYVFYPDARKYLEKMLIPRAENCRPELRQILDFIFLCGSIDPAARPQTGQEMTEVLTGSTGRSEA